MSIFVNYNHRQKPFSLESITEGHIQEAVHRPNGYPYYLWLMTASGCGVIYPDDHSEILLYPGQGILLPADSAYHYMPLADNTWITSYVTFSGNMSDRIPQVLGTSDYLLAEDNSHFSFSAFVHQMAERFPDSERVDQDELSSSTYHLLLMIHKYSDLSSTIYSEKYSTYIYPVLKIIREQYASNLTVSALANAVYVSPQYLSRLFHSYMGMSTIQYIQRFRIHQALKMLHADPKLSVQEICQRVGFSDTSRFIQTFKRELGYTPGQFSRTGKLNQHYDMIK